MILLVYITLKNHPCKNNKSHIHVSIKFHIKDIFYFALEWLLWTGPVLGKNVNRIWLGVISSPFGGNTIFPLSITAFQVFHKSNAHIKVFTFLGIVSISKFTFKI